MSLSIDKIAGSEETHSGSLVRGGIAFLGGLILCGAAILAQAALLHAVSGSSKKTN
jgi:hypothetical protein